MNEVSKLNINNQEYVIKDEQARTELGQLGNLAYVDSATGEYTPVGTISTPVITADTSKESVSKITDVGTQASWSARVTSDGALVFSFEPNTLPTYTDVEVVSNINEVQSEEPIFTGETSTINVS